MMYEVWTKHENGELGVLLLNALRQDCESYVEQAIKKGADPDSMVILRQNRYVIKREDYPGQMLEGLGIGCNANPYTETTEWSTSLSRALRFNEFEAKATVEFIQNVIDWKLSEQLIIEMVEE